MAQPLQNSGLPRRSHAISFVPKSEVPTIFIHIQGLSLSSGVFFSSPISTPKKYGFHTPNIRWLRNPAPVDGLSHYSPMKIRVFHRNPNSYKVVPPQL